MNSAWPRRLLFPLSFILLSSLADAQLHFASLGNWGSGSASQYSVGTLLKSQAKQHQLSLIVSPGANFVDGIHSLEDKHWSTAFEIPYGGQELHIPFFTVLGMPDWDANYTAQILRTNLTYDKGADEKQILAPQWTLPNFWYHYSMHFSDASEANAAYGGTDGSIGFVFVDTFILSDRFPYQNITKLHWDATKATIAAATQIFDWVVVVGDKAILSSGASKGDSYLADTLRQLMRDYKVDVYISGNDYDMEVIEDGSLLHINCGTGSSFDVIGRVKADNSVLYISRPGFCHHIVTRKSFMTEFIDGFTGHVVGNYTKSRNIRERTLFGRFNVFQGLPGITYVEVPPWKNIAAGEDDLFLRICGSIGLITLVFLLCLLSSAVGNRVVKVIRGR